MLQLSRWREHLPFTVPLTALGVTLALRHNAAGSLDWRLGIVLLANSLAVMCAFMVNDAEDAADDARDPQRAARNPVVTGRMPYRRAWVASLASGGIAWGLYAVINPYTWGIGSTTLALAYLYSWRSVRLKAYPLVDVVSHALMLSTLLLLAGYFAYDAAPGAAWWVALGVGCVSAYGQLYNQLRDYEMDQAAGLHNTAAIVGPATTRRLMYSALVAAAGCGLAAIASGLLPLWLLLVPVLALPAGWLLRSGVDMRGTVAIDVSGQMQPAFLLIANLAVWIWLISMAL